MISIDLLTFLKVLPTLGPCDLIVEYLVLGDIRAVPCEGELQLVIELNHVRRTLT